VPQAAANRKGETWQAPLKQFPNLEFVVSEQASALRKGVQDCPQDIAQQYDVFPFKREVGRWLRAQEARCYELMEQVAQARQWTEQPRLLDSARLQARSEYRQQAAALDERWLAFAGIELIVGYLDESFTPYAARRNQLRARAAAEAVFDEVRALLKEIKLSPPKPLLSTIEGARPGLLTFLTVLEKKLAEIAVNWHVVTGSRSAAFNALAQAWHTRPHAHTSPRGQRAALAALLNLQPWNRRIENFSKVERQVCAALEQVVRASSAVGVSQQLAAPLGAREETLGAGFSSAERALPQHAPAQTTRPANAAATRGRSAR
jgi:hypothetical protein